MKNQDLRNYMEKSINIFRSAIQMNELDNTEYYFYNMVQWIGACLEYKRQKENVMLSLHEKNLIMAFRFASNTFKHCNYFFDLKRIKRNNGLALWSKNVIEGKYSNQYEAYLRLLQNKEILNTVEEISKIVYKSMAD